MAIKTRKTAPLGELIAAVFDEAARYSTDPRLVAQLTTRAVQQMIEHTRKAAPRGLRASRARAPVPTSWLRPRAPRDAA